MGKRLFEQGGDVAPSLDMRLASGKAGTPTVNHTWQTVVTWLETVLNFLKKTENLNDLPNKTTARANLDVYSTIEVNALLDEKADVDNVLALDNTTPYVPSDPYHPATNQQILAIGHKCIGYGWFGNDGVLLGWVRNDAADTTITITTTRVSLGIYRIDLSKNMSKIFIIANTISSGDGQVNRMIAKCDFPFSTLASNSIGIIVSKGEGTAVEDSGVYFQIFQKTF